MVSSHHELGWMEKNAKQWASFRSCSRNAPDSDANNEGSMGFDVKQPLSSISVVTVAILLVGLVAWCLDDSYSIA